MRKYIALAALLFSLAATPLFAQTINFTSDVTQAAGSATPTLSWSTDPVADSCTASGDWSGAKGPSGSETLATISSSATYTLTCFWPATGAVTLSWTPPTENTDGSPLTDLAGYRLYYGVESGVYPGQVDIDNPGVTTYVVEGLADGTWYFAATAINSAGIESDYSDEAVKTVSGTDASEAVSVVVNPKPNPPGGLTAE